jgi:lysyl-tRNA synthetase class 1
MDILLSELDENWSLEGLTSVIYNIPKMLLNLPPDTRPTPALKQAQRQLFKAIYALICGSETGPRIPALFLSLGQKQVKILLTREE